MYRVSVVKRPSTSETPLLVPCCILFFLGIRLFILSSRVHILVALGTNAV